MDAELGGQLLLRQSGVLAQHGEMLAVGWTLSLSRSSHTKQP